jgi:hypothetical protein
MRGIPAAQNRLDSNNGEGRTVAKHNVSFSMPERDLGRADVEFLVKQDGVVLGTLAVSNGSLVWFPRGTSYGCKMGWTKFDENMQKLAKRFEKR